MGTRERQKGQDGVGGAQSLLTLGDGSGGREKRQPPGTGKKHFAFSPWPISPAKAGPACTVEAGVYHSESGHMWGC